MSSGKRLKKDGIFCIIIRITGNRKTKRTGEHAGGIGHGPVDHIRDDLRRGGADGLEHLLLYLLCPVCAEPKKLEAERMAAACADPAADLFPAIP